MTVGDMKRKVVHYLHLHHCPGLSPTGSRDVSGVNRGAVDVPGEGGGGDGERGDTLCLYCVAHRISRDQPSSFHGES